MVYLLHCVGAQMKFTSIVAVAALMTTFGAGISQAQSFRDQPAEFPSASYKGKQYVDSKGCVFIRAGIDGNVTWVPRVSRKRQGVCGFKPTNVQTAASAPAGGADAPVQITVNNAPAAAKQPTVAARPLPQRKAKPVVVRQKAPKPVRQPVPRSVDVPAAPRAQALAGQTVRVAGQVAFGARPAAGPAWHLDRRPDH